MNSIIFSRANITRLLVVAMAAQMGATALAADRNPSPRARERANENARFNRDRNRDRALSDEQFISEAYQRGKLELKLAHAAVQNSQEKDVQTIGHRIINEQGRAVDDLKKIASSKNVTLQTDLASADQQTFERLSKLQGAEFDRAYREHLTSDYKQTIQMYQDAARNARDSQVRDVASQYAALFEEHAPVIGITGLQDTEGSRSYVRESEAARVTGPLSQKDQQFLTRVHRSSRTEMQAAQLAAKNSRDRQIQSLAQTIVTDHKSMEQDLKDLASRRNLTLPRQLGEGQEDLLQKLGKLSGNNFDKEYHAYLMQSHKNALELFEDGAASTDADVRNFATKYRDSLREHLRAAQQAGDGAKR